MRSMRALKPSTTLPSDTEVVKRKACTACCKRRVKCDRLDPCSTCASWNIACSYPPSQRTCRRAAKRSPSSPRRESRNSSPQFLENAFQRLLAEATIATGRSSNTDKDVLLSWTMPTLSTEAAQELQAVKESLEKTLSLLATWTAKHSVLTDALNSRNTWMLNTSTLHPSPAKLPVYHNIFFQRIDPLVKVLHRPTAEALLTKAQRDPTSLLDGELAVVLSIYLASLCSMSDADALACSIMPKHIAIATYKGAVEHALARANLGATDDLATMQAFVLYLGLNRCAETSTSTTQSQAKRPWAPTGLVSRVVSSSSTATVDDASQSPFDQEMRKRLHLTLWYLEHRNREDLARNLFSSEQQWTTTDELALPTPMSQPTNARDVHLDPRMRLPPTPCQGWTEVSFSLLQAELATAARMVRMASSTLTHRVAIIDACERRVETRYLRYCDGSLAVHWLARHVAYVLMMELRFQVYGAVSSVLDGSMSWSWSWLSSNYQEEQHEVVVPSDRLVLDAVDMLDAERRIQLQGETQAAQWSWLLAGYLQFWPLVFLLGRLCSGCEPLWDGAVRERAWRVAERSFRHWERPESRNAGSRYLEVLCRLWSQAQAARASPLAWPGQWACSGVVVGAGSEVPALCASSDAAGDFPDFIWQTDNSVLGMI